MSDIDPVQYGQLIAKVSNMEAKIDRLERHIEELLMLANKGKGGLWAGMALVSFVSSAVGYVLHMFNKS